MKSLLLLALEGCLYKEMGLSPPVAHVRLNALFA